jgi:transposase InsO family protein
LRHRFGFWEEVEMPWKESDVRSERIRFVVEAVSGEWTMSGLCRRYGISRPTGYKWLRRYREVGSVSELEEQSRRPRHSPRQTPEWIEDRVEQLRRRHGWAGRKLSRLLAQEGIHVARSTVDRILKRRGLVEPSTSHRPAAKRFERARPNDLWQMDFKGPYRLAAGGVCHPLSLLDDHSRYVVGLYALASTHGNGVKQCLMKTWHRYGLPRAVLMDHGSPWWATSNGHGLTRLSVLLIDQGVDLIYASIGHPQTQGKVERFHRTLDQALHHRGIPRSLDGFSERFSDWRCEYNQQRPHEALGDQTPQSHYRPSRRTYNPRPRPWQYPEGSDLRSISDAGLLNYGGEKYFVCHALGGQLVRCQRFDHRLLVTYRHMMIREIDLESGRTTAVVRPERWKNV